jgi:hypothetical protein
MSFDTATTAKFRDRNHKAMEMFRTHELPRQDSHLAKTSGAGQQQDQRSTAETPNERSTNTALRRNRNSEATGAEDEDESRGNDGGRRVQQKKSDDGVSSIHDLILLETVIIESRKLSLTLKSRGSSQVWSASDLFDWFRCATSPREDSEHKG